MLIIENRRTFVLVCSTLVVESKQVCCQAWALFFWEADHLGFVSKNGTVFGMRDIPLVCFLSLLRFLRKLS